MILEDDAVLTRQLRRVADHISWINERIDLAPLSLGDWSLNGPIAHVYSADPRLRFGNGPYTFLSSYMVRRDYFAVLRHTWTKAVELLSQETLSSELSPDQVRTLHGRLWHLDLDAVTVPLQAGDRWLIFDPQLGGQDRNQFGTDTLAP